MTNPFTKLPQDIQKKILKYLTLDEIQNFATFDKENLRITRNTGFAKAKRKPDFFQNLPNEIVVKILSYLNREQLGFFSRVEKRGHEVGEAHMLQNGTKKEADAMTYFAVAGTVRVTKSNSSISGSGYTSHHPRKVPTSEVLESFNNKQKVKLFTSFEQAKAYAQSKRYTDDYGTEDVMAAPVYVVETKQSIVSFTHAISVDVNKNRPKILGVSKTPPVEVNYLVTTPDNCSITGYTLEGKEVNLENNDKKNCCIM